MPTTTGSSRPSRCSSIRARTARSCNGCYVVLGEIVAKVSGRRYEDYITEHVFTPAGMTGAGYLPIGPPAGRHGAGLYRGAQAWRPLQNARDTHGVAGSAAGGCYATAADLLAFDNALRTGKLLDREDDGLVPRGRAAAEPGARARGGIGIRRRRAGHERAARGRRALGRRRRRQPGPTGGGRRRAWRSSSSSRGDGAARGRTRPSDADCQERATPSC